MDTRVWGPHAWKLFHTISFAFPDSPTHDDVSRFSKFFYSAAEVLPCATCRMHFVSLLRDDPPEKHMTSRNDFTQWLVKVHNQVNKRLGKPHVSFGTVQDEYESIRGRTCEHGTQESQVCPPLKTSKKCGLTVALTVSILAAALIVAGAIALVCLKKKQRL